MNVLSRKVVARAVALLASFAVMATGSLVAAGSAAADASTTLSGTVSVQSGWPTTGVAINGGTLDAAGRFVYADQTWATVDASGRFSVDVVADQGVRYPVYWISGESGRTQADGVWYGSWAQIPVALGTTISLVQYKYAQTDQALDLVVTGVPTGTGVSLYLWEDGTGWRNIDYATTDATGKVSFDAYKGRRYTVRISSSTVSHTQYLGGSEIAPETSTAPGTFGTNGDVSATYTAAVVPYGAAAGRISWATVVPTAATVTLLRWTENGDGSGFWTKSGETPVNPDASFRLDNLIPGETYSAYITSTNTDGTQTHVTTWLGGSTVTPTEKAHVWSFVATGGGTYDYGVVPVTTLAGRINAELHGFLAGQSITVIAYDLAKGVSRTVDTRLYASSGAKVIEGLEPGTYWVYASSTNQGQATHYSQALGVTVTSGGTTTIGLVASSAMPSSGARLVAKIDGVRRVGETLTARPLLTKAPEGFASTVSYQYVWRDGKKILGTGPTLKLTPVMMDKTASISVFVLASAPGYTSRTATAGISTDYAAVDPGLRPVPTKVPTLTGKVGFGKKLTAHPGKWSPAPTGYTYQWLRDGAPIKGATARTYKPRRSDAGARISVRVTPVLEGHDVLGLTTPRTKALPKVAGTVKAKLAKKTITAKQRAKVTFTVRSKGVSPITGKVTITYGKKSRTVTLKPGHKGKATVTLPRLKKGTHKVTVTYKGGAKVKKASLKKALTLRVR